MAAETTLGPVASAPTASMRIAVGNDHAGFGLKVGLVRHLRGLGNEVVDLGHDSTERADYPIFGRRVAQAVAAGDVERGIVICGTGVGISIAANKVNGIRCVCCSEPYSALLSRQHNDTNVLALGARVVGSGLARLIVETWLSARFEGGRHATRVHQLAAVEAERSGRPLPPVDAGGSSSGERR